jgi:predicted ATPase
LRAGIDLAKLWQREGRTSEARHLLLPIYGRFSEGFETTDLRAARVLLRDFARARSH